MTKPTVATLKSFIRKNSDNILIRVKSSFDGMEDGVREYSGGFRPITNSKQVCDNNLGYEGVWLVGSSRDYVTHYSKDGMVGYEVHNCCGTWIVAIIIKAEGK